MAWTAAGSNVSPPSSSSFNTRPAISFYNDNNPDWLTPEQLAELTQIALLQVDLEVSWGEPPRDRSERFTTIKAIRANQLENRP